MSASKSPLWLSWLGFRVPNAPYEPLHRSAGVGATEMAKMSSASTNAAAVNGGDKTRYSTLPLQGKKLPVPPSRLHPIRHGYWSVYYGRLRKLEGYHFVILYCALSGVVVILINFIFTIWAIATFGVDDGIGTLQEGDCHKTKSINFWIHLAINILSTALLSASNFAMQCLTSPTRHDIDKAHAQRKWLDVGVPSFRNLRRLSRDRVILWYLLASSSIPLHLLYNSTVFATLSTQQYNVLLVSKEFTAGSPFAVANTSFDSTSNYQAQSSASDIAKLLHKYQSNLTSLTRLENKACLDTYASSIISTHSDLVLVSDYSNQANSYLVSNPDTNSPILPSLSGLANQWMCAMPATYAAQECQTDTQSPHPDPDHWTIKLYPPLSEYYGGGVPDQGPQNPLSQVSTNIQYCLSQPVKEQCQTQFSLGIMIAVLACNLVKVICLGYIAWKHDTEPLVTLGDAIASFLKEPDVTTGGAPLYNKSRFKGSNMWDATSTSKLSRLWGLRRLSRRRGSRWFRTISKRRWMIYGLLWWMALFFAFCMLFLATNTVQSSSLAHIWSLGFGNVNSETVITEFNYPGASGLVATVVMANLPQIFLSFLYFTYNGTFTCMLLSHEWSKYASKRRALRVSSPRGVQNGTYRLQLPYQYGVPLLVGSGLLHWLASQSIFLVRMHVYDSDGMDLPEQGISTCGFSPMPLILLFALGCALVMFGVGSGLRKYKTQVPLAGSCSAVISAACHPPSGSIDTTLSRVMWEEIDHGGLDGVGADARQYSFI